MKNICPLCSKELLKKSNDTEVDDDYKCINNDDKHFYIHRLKDNRITKFKVKIQDTPGKFLFVKVNFDSDLAFGYSAVWTNENFERIIINSTFELVENTSIDKLKNKIKTLLTFG